MNRLIILVFSVAVTMSSAVPVSVLEAKKFFDDAANHKKMDYHKKIENLRRSDITNFKTHPSYSYTNPDGSFVIISFIGKDDEQIPITTTEESTDFEPSLESQSKTPTDYIYDTLTMINPFLNGLLNTKPE